MEMTNRPRIAFLDNIRWTVIAMVVLMHAFVTYGGLGSWYYKEAAPLGMAETLAFYLYQILSQAFFMGILFFVAATLTPGAYDRKGFGKFLLDRFVRLGLPALIYMLVLHPLTVLVQDTGMGRAFSLADIGRLWLSYVLSGTFLSSSGPLWFVIALLAFSLAYGLYRGILGIIRPATNQDAQTKPRSTRVFHAGALALIAIIAFGSFCVRLVQPMGTSWFNMQFCFFFQYIALFCVGLWATRSGLLEWLPRAAGRTWLGVALGIGIPGLLLLLGLGGALQGKIDLYGGGWHWQAAAYAAWESFFCVSMCIGILALYRDRLNTRNPVTGLLSQTCFGVYCFHAPLLVGTSMVIKNLVLFPLAKALLAATIAWTISVGAAWLVRRIPGIGKLFQ